MAYSNLAQLRMLEEDAPGAVRWGMQALALAETLGDDEIQVHALTNVGTAQYSRGEEEGRARLETSLRIALERGFEEHAGRAFTNLGSCAAVLRQYARASRYFDEGIAYCAEHDLDLWRLYMAGWRARIRLEMGDWTGAADEASEVLASYRLSPVMRTPALVVLIWLRLRRGDPGSAPILDELREMARRTGEPQRIAPVAVARAEAAWLRGDLATCQAEARTGYELTREHAGSFNLGQLYYWLWKSGAQLDIPAGLPEPYALQCSGDWRSAAAAWERIGCPFERALALAEGDAKARRDALAILDDLGASATAQRLKQEWGTARPEAIPRGPRPSTRGNPAGLTNQQLEVLRLMADGLHNAEIAQTLHVSPKTVEHHVSAVLVKLNARSRAQAVAQAHNMGVISHISPNIGGEKPPR
jgi:DNA-binding CsgD family transcriptional regulator